MTRQSFSKIDSDSSHSTRFGNFGLSFKKARHDHQDAAVLFRTLLHEVMTAQTRVLGMEHLTQYSPVSV
jgi:hypothetical protein